VKYAFFKKAETVEISKHAKESESQQSCAGHQASNTWLLPGQLR
jgi:hypothetical protein